MCWTPEEELQYLKKCYCSWTSTRQAVRVLYPDLSGAMRTLRLTGGKENTERHTEFRKKSSNIWRKATVVEQALARTWDSCTQIYLVLCRISGSLGVEYTERHAEFQKKSSNIWRKATVVEQALPRPWESCTQIYLVLCRISGSLGVENTERHAEFQKKSSL